jgi:hypothetical protein
LDAPVSEIFQGKNRRNPKTKNRSGVDVVWGGKFCIGNNISGDGHRNIYIGFRRKKINGDEKFELPRHAEKFSLGGITKMK